MKLYRDFTTQEQIDAQYNFDAIYPERDKIIDAQFARSRRAHETSDVRSVNFGPSLDERLDIFPVESAPAPIFVFIHGGFWHMELSTEDFALTTLAARSAGMAAIVTNYSTAPKVSIDEITRQSRAAVAWIYRNAHTFGGDPEQIYVAGHSAGGHQVAMLLNTDWASDYGLPPTVIKGGIAISGLYDLRPFIYSWLAPKLLLTQETIARQSPLFNVRHGATPLLVVTAENEPLEMQRQADEYLAAWREVGNKGWRVVVPEVSHLDVIEGFADTSSPLWEKITRILGVNQTNQDEA